MNQPLLPLSTLDSTYLDIETAKTPMHLACLLLTDAAPLLDGKGRVRMRAVRSHVAQRWEPYRATHVRLHTGANAVPPYAWELSPGHDLTGLVRLSHVPGRGTDRDVLNHCAEILKPRLSRDLPMWRLHVLSGISRKRIGFLLQFHHSMVDGAGGAALLRALMDSGESTPAAQPPTTGEGGSETTSPANMRSVTNNRFTRAAKQALRIADGAAFLASATRLRPSTSLNAPVTAARRLDTRQIGLGTVRAIARALDVTVNDVVLSAVAGSLGTMLGERGDPVDEMVLEALVPVAVRTGGGPEDGGDQSGGEPGNHTAVLQVPLPIGMADAVQRTLAIHAATRSRKRHHAADAVGSIETLADDLHLPVLHGLVRLAIDHQPLVNLVVTNVPGPREPMSFMGAKVRSVVPFLPLGHDLPLAVTVSSYGETLSIGVQSDPTLCDDAPSFAAGVVEELTALQQLTG